MTKKNKNLTHDEYALLGFLDEYLKEYDGMPTCRDICKHFKAKSTATAHNWLKGLEREGFIEYHQPSRYRFTRK